MAALPFSTLEFFKVRAPEIISVVNKKSPSVALISPPNVTSPLVVIAPPSAIVMANVPSV